MVADLKYTNSLMQLIMKCQIAEPQKILKQTFLNSILAQKANFSLSCFSTSEEKKIHFLLKLFPNNYSIPNKAQPIFFPLRGKRLYSVQLFCTACVFQIDRILHSIKHFSIMHL